MEGEWNTQSISYQPWTLWAYCVVILCPYKTYTLAVYVLEIWISRWLEVRLKAGTHDYHLHPHTHTRQNWKVGERVWRYFFFRFICFPHKSMCALVEKFCTRALFSISFTLSTVLNSNSVGVKILFHFRSCGSMAAAQFPHPPDTPGHHFFSSCLSGRLSWPRTLSLVHSRRTRNGEMLIKQ